MQTRLIKFFFLLILGAVTCLPRMALGNVLNFDDINTGISGFTAIFDYGGFTWLGPDMHNGPATWAVESNLLCRSQLNITYDFPSMDNAAYNANGDGRPYTVTSNVPFTFNGAFLGPLLERDDQGRDNQFIQGENATSVTVTGYLNNNLVGSQTIKFSAPYYPLSGLVLIWAGLSTNFPS